jgi:proteasome lid subunit RPN8/RPN11
MVIPPDLYDELVAHARAEAPNECCGIVAAVDGRAVKVFRARNTAASALKYEMDSTDQLRAYLEIEDSGWELAAVYHSHTRTPPYPSQTDINQAGLLADALHIIVGVAQDEPEVRAFRIMDGAVDEVELARG